MKRHPAPPLRTLDASTLAHVRGGLDLQAETKSKSWWDTAKEWAAPALTGAAGGALAGGATGSVFPGVGTLFGAGVGAIGGAATGLAAHAAGKLIGNATGQSVSSSLAPQGGGAKDTLAQALSPPDPSSGQGAKEVAKKAVESGASPKEVEEMVTLFHLTNAPKWGQGIADAKQAGTAFNQLDRPIDPFYTLKQRQAGAEGVRGGDDVGPGFYTGDSADFVEKYGKGFGDGGVVQFQIAKKHLDALKHKDIAPDDAATFQKFMKDGFPTMKQDGTVKAPKLDRKPPAFDLVSGPINDVDAVNAKYTEAPKNAKGTAYSPGEILQIDGKTPLQYNFATQAGAEALYSKASNITYTDYKAFVQQHQANKH